MIEFPESFYNFVQTKIYPGDTITKDNIFTHRESHPLTLNVLLLNKFGPEYILWDPEILISEIEKEFKTEISNLNRNKVMALQCAFTKNTLWNEWEHFLPTIQAFNNIIPHFNVLVKPTICECEHGVSVLKIIDKKKEFSPEVGKFIAAVFLENGISYLPSPLDFAQEFALLKVAICKDCGFIEFSDGDEICNFCGGEVKNVPSFDNTLIIDLLGKYKDLRDLPEKEEYPYPQAAQLLLADDYCEFRREQLKHQINILGLKNE